MSDNGVEPKEERYPFTSTWTIEWKDKVSHVVNTQEENDYTKALSLFNELSSSGKDVVLYEIRTPIADPSAQPKKIPILNSAKVKKRIPSGGPKPRVAGVSERITNASKSSRTSSLKDLRTRILILVAVIAVFVIILFLISVLFTGSDLAHNFSIFTFSIKSPSLGLNI
ncbi:MAG: hypothetical protein WBX01_12655 [Nitrososphaeraceae archaeon]|jgi:hypothetical protein